MTENYLESVENTLKNTPFQLKTPENGKIGVEIREESSQENRKIELKDYYHVPRGQFIAYVVAHEAEIGPLYRGRFNDFQLHVWRSTQPIRQNHLVYVSESSLVRLATKEDFEAYNLPHNDLILPTSS